jgi:hypothetical protein
MDRAAREKSSPYAAGKALPYCRAGEAGMFIVGVKTLKVQLIPSGLARKLLLFCAKRT